MIPTGPKSNGECLNEREKGRPCADGGKDQSEAAIAQETPGATGSRKAPGRDFL